MKRNNFLFICIITYCLIYSCTSRLKIPSDLRKLSAFELKERAREGKTAPVGVNILMENGESFTSKSIMELAKKKLFTDQYVDSNGVTKLILIRKATNSDKKLFAEIEKLYENSNQVQLIDVNCKNIKDILRNVYQKDQSSRSGFAENGPNSDKENQQVVLSIINKCGFPTPPLVDRSDLETIFLVFQHGTKEQRSKYFTYFKELANKGDFSKSMLALMEDRVLIDAGEKQKFGTQVMRKQDGNWEMYPVESPELLNKRRTEIGLIPINDYLKSFHQ